MRPSARPGLSFVADRLSLEELKAETAATARAQTLAHALAFMLGFSVVFVVLGLTASAIGGVLNAQPYARSRRSAASSSSCSGLQMMGMIRIPFLMMDKRAHVQHDRRTFWTSLLVGMAFAAGWSPCIGPILAGILAVASQQHNGEAALLLVATRSGLARAVFR